MKTVITKIISLAFLTILFISPNSCKDKGVDTDLTYNVVVEDHSAPYSFPGGFYYSYTFPQPYSFEYNVDSVFKIVSERRVKLKDAWYKSYNTNCVPPGGTISMPAIVEPSLLVRLESPSPILELSGFTQIDSPNTGFCNYRVNHYIF